MRLALTTRESSPLSLGLTNIEAVHRGFLYQHLFAVGLLLRADTYAFDELVVEGQEDIEVVRPGVHQYVQVKTRSGSLGLGDVKATLARFERLLSEHASGQRIGTPEFFIVTNSEPTAELRDEIGRYKAIAVLTPTAAPRKDLPLPWRRLTDAFAWCAESAADVPFSRLQPDTLVWKLATEVAFACTGERPEGHSFTPEMLPALCEQFLVQLHRIPAPPATYRSQVDEPPFLLAGGRLRLIIGHSGSGKTAWASQHSVHSVSDTVYVDAAETPPTALASTVARELGGALLHAGDKGVREAVLPGSQPLEGLRALSELVSRRGRPVTLLLDNVHLLDAETLRRVVQATPDCEWILLGQPGPEIPAVQALLQVNPEALGGFSLEAIAAEFQDCASALDVATAARVRALTGGLPLFVRDTALLTARHYGHDARQLCGELEAATNATTTGQQAILGRVVSRLSPDAREAVAVIGLSEVRLHASEARRLLAEILVRQDADAAALLRELSTWGVFEPLGDGALRLHDAYRPLASQLQQALSGDSLQRTRIALAQILRESFAAGQFDRLIAYCRLAPLIGETETLINVASDLSEHLQERGRVPELLKIVEDASQSEAVPVLDRFWAADAAMFWRFKEADVEELQSRMKRLEELLALAVPSARAQRALLVKRLLLASRRRDSQKVRATYRELAESMAAGDGEYDRIARYDYALALWECDEADVAYGILSGLAGDYLRALDLRPTDLFRKQPHEIKEILGSRGDDIDELKRLADTFDLLAMVVNNLGASSGVLRMWAYKLYLLASAYSSAIRVGQDVVDELLRFGDLRNARSMLEGTLLQLVKQERLLAHLVPVQAQYAVVLAYCGEDSQAKALLGELERFALSEYRRDELENQKRLVVQIERGRARLSPPPPGPGDISRIQAVEDILRKLGRNEDCFCQSGLKFKRCCGRSNPMPLNRLLMPI